LKAESEYLETPQGIAALAVDWCEAGAGGYYTPDDYARMRAEIERRIDAYASAMISEAMDEG
jgi:hypothetical protein